MHAGDVRTAVWSGVLATFVAMAAGFWFPAVALPALDLPGPGWLRGMIWGGVSAVVVGLTLFPLLYNGSLFGTAWDGRMAFRHCLAPDLGWGAGRRVPQTLDALIRRRENPWCAAGSVGERWSATRR